MPDENVKTGKFASRPMPRKFLPVLILGVVLFITIVSSFYTINANERGVVTRFGRYRATVEEGLHWKIPLGIDVVYKVTQQVLSKQFGFRTLQAGVNTTYSSGDYWTESEMLTGDLNIVNANWIIQYRIVNPRAWLFNVDDRSVSRIEDNRDKTLRDVTQSVVNQLVGDRAILDVMSTERDSIAFQAKLMIQEHLDSYDIGVRISEVRMQQIEPPQGEVQDAFEDVNKAVQDRDRLINEGERSYYAEIPRIEGEAKQKVEEAGGYKEARINKALGDVALFQAIYEEYRQAPEVTRTRLYYETLTEIFSETENSDLIDKNLENFLPLKQLGTGGEQ